MEMMSATLNERAKKRLRVGGGSLARIDQQSRLLLNLMRLERTIRVFCCSTSAFAVVVQSIKTSGPYTVEAFVADKVLAAGARDADDLVGCSAGLDRCRRNSDKPWDSGQQHQHL